MFKKIVSIFLVNVLLTGCSLVPIPQEARDAFDEIKSHLKKDSTGYSLSEIPDGPTKRYVQDISKKLSQLSGIETVVTILATDSVQATSSFDSPQILITRGMLNSISNEAELAAVISHEIGHKALHHTEPPRGSTFIDGVVSKGVAKASGNESLGYELSSDMRDIKWSLWSQTQEQEADEFAIRLCKEAGYSSEALPTLLERLSKASGNTLVQRLATLKNSHKSLGIRASHLKKFTESNDLAFQGVTNERKFREAIQSLYSVSRDVVDRETLNKIASIKLELQTLSRQGKRLSVGHFINIMDEVIRLARQNNIDISKLIPDASHTKGHGFMEEAIQEPKPFWSFNSLSLPEELRDLILSVARIGIAFVPGINNIAALYEVLTGRDFVSQKEIGIGGRALSALGLAMMAGTEWRQVASGIESAITAEGSQLTRAEVSPIQKSLEVADEVTEESKLYGRSRLGEEFNHYAEGAQGPLAADDAETFMGSKYREVYPRQGEKFYRVGDDEGNWWSRVKPTSQIRSMSENAVLPDWNKFDKISEITVPGRFNESVYEGLSGSMGGKILKNGNYASNFFHGGGNQIYIDESVLKSLKGSGAIKGGKF